MGGVLQARGMEAVPRQTHAGADCVQGQGGGYCEGGAAEPEKMNLRLPYCTRCSKFRLIIYFPRFYFLITN